MANIKLPGRFKRKIENDHQYAAIMYEVLSTFGEILQDNKLYFFGEYTDHGIRHVENVIAAADNLIPDETLKEVLTEKDITCYVLVAILHDIAMHLTLDGFNYIINGGFDDVRVAKLDELTWSALWERYLEDAKRFNGNQLNAIFGNENTVVRRPPLLNGGEINENDKKLIGEFIRRYHPRLAHEIALKGFPGKAGTIPFAANLDVHIRSLTGLIARSHGMDLRQCSDYIEGVYSKHSRRYPHNLHAVYLMVVLRIADYLQIDSSRTSEVLIRIKSFASPFSAMAHQAHLAIDSVDMEYQADPERILVTASPATSAMYLKLKALIKDIQQEMDISWSVLGELYGNHDKKPGIKYRRIMTNLNDSSFIANQIYVADTFSFTTNNEVTRLLIAPLYGDDPKYGVRELLHNAIDACNERDELERKWGNDKYEPAIKVEITKEGSDHYFTITDNGRGMNAKVIKDYFLTCGASLRVDAAWQKEFIDEEGNCTINRSGRFGVGALAAFLIGPDIEVLTRRLGEDVGYRFFAGLDTTQIEVIKDKKIKRGTTIRIKIDKQKKYIWELDSNYGIAFRHEWCRWYRLTYPKVSYFIEGREEALYRTFDPGVNDPLPPEWNAFDAPGFQKVLWTYKDGYENNKLTCNGIVIYDNEFDEDKKHIDLGLLTMPKVSIIDNNALTPFTLNRKALSDVLPFLQLLKEEIYKDYLARVLMFQHVSTVDGTAIHLMSQHLNYPGLRYKIPEDPQGQLDYLLINSKGIIINTAYTISKLGAQQVVTIESMVDSDFPKEIKLDLKGKCFLFAGRRFFTIEDYKSILHPIKVEEDDVFVWNYKTIPARVFLKKKDHEYLFYNTQKVSKSLKGLYNEQSFGQKWIKLETGDPDPDSIISAEFLERYPFHLIKEYTITMGSTVKVETLESVLQKYLGDDPVIPFALEDRKKKFPLAFKELARYMKKYESKVVEVV